MYFISLFTYAMELIKKSAEMKSEIFLMGVVQSNFDKHLKRRDHALAESETWVWYHQISTSTSKDVVTHFLRAGHGHGTIKFRQAPQKTTSRTH